MFRQPWRRAARAGVLRKFTSHTTSAHCADSGGVTVTNAVSIRTSLAFVANGACGVRVVDLGRWYPQAAPGTTVGLTVLGSIGS